MEKREDLRSMLPYLPVVLQSSYLVWPPQVMEMLEAMSKGPTLSQINSGEALSLAIVNMRQSLSFKTSISPFSAQGYTLFFDQKMSKAESTRWFGEVMPALAGLALRLPSLLETHYLNADDLHDGTKTGLRLLGPQEAGIVFLSKELIAAVLACAFFCLFPVTERDAKRLPSINFDELFACIYTGSSAKEENKIRCIVHYFERIYSGVPTGFVSFERKVLPLENHPFHLAYPQADFWSTSIIPLCPCEVHTSGLIEDQSGEALEVDFADEYFGGLVLCKGCLQEEIRFLINPECIAGMLFLPSMDNNEAIEIVGPERFSCYTGYFYSFQFAGDYVDKREADIFGRRKTRIIAIDALRRAGMRQYELKFLIREINKALCGFLHQGKYKRQEGESVNRVVRTSNDKDDRNVDCEDGVGVATGNWGCGAFRGDPQLKTMIQWLAASQAGRPFMAYYTFGLDSLQNLDQVSKRILSHEWTVGYLWNKIVEYSSQRLEGRTSLGFFAWLAP